MNNWQDISTAPKDGKTPVWLWYPKVNRAVEGITYSYTNGSVGTSSAFKGIEATHWQPLPAPPIAE